MDSSSNVMMLLNVYFSRDSSHTEPITPKRFFLLGSSTQTIPTRNQSGLLGAFFPASNQENCALRPDCPNTNTYDTAAFAHAWILRSQGNRGRMLSQNFLAIFLDSGIIPTANVSYPWFAVWTCLLANGFVGFQFAEDGAALSLWSFSTSPSLNSDVQEYRRFRVKNSIGLRILYSLWPLICTDIYIVTQLMLVFRSLDDRWPIGDIVFGTAFFTIAQALLFAFSHCDAIQHYIDGLFFFTLCVLLSVTMVYKYWDSIKREDLEFSVGSKPAVWEVKDPLLTRGGSKGRGSMMVRR
ncbi:hypothetical protein ONZ45_g9453 [Pleurotus djamor]|nr:hypothetical protein ONZ45_g9453 [Pleurotus djamor]